ncbi:MAG: TfoX/Sxy family protein [Alphaproteobacteria bacterium]|nr:TfoX/Sxy family protein [Alphaproteobacteria bacterium]
MAINAAFRDHIADLFNPYGAVTFKRFFGGTGLYHKERLFGFIMRDRVYLKTNDETRAAYEAEGAEPFTFKNAAGETITISYYELPARLHDDTDELGRWVRQAHDVATVPRTRKRAISKGKLPSDLPLLPAKKKKK